MIRHLATDKLSKQVACVSILLLIGNFDKCIEIVECRHHFFQWEIVNHQDQHLHDVHILDFEQNRANACIANIYVQLCFA